MAWEITRVDQVKDKEMYSIGLTESGSGDSFSFEQRTNNFSYPAVQEIVDKKISEYESKKADEAQKLQLLQANITIGGQ